MEPRARSLNSRPPSQADSNAARELAKRIRAGAIADGATVRSVYRKGWTGLDNKQVVDAGLGVLEDAGWCQVVEEKRDKGGRPREIIRLHPELLQGVAK